MITGLTWANVRWIALFFLLLVMIASADGAYRLNWKIAFDAYNKVQLGAQNLNKAQKEAAKQLDANTQKRYGYDPIEPRAKSCVTTPNSSAVIPSDKLVRLTQGIPDRTTLIQTIGEPYCQQASGFDIWLVGATKVLEAEYNPLKFQLKEVKPQ